MRTNQTTPCGGDSLDTVVNNAIARLIGVPAQTPIQEFVVALERSIPRAGAVGGLLPGRELPYTQRILAASAGVQVEQITGAIRRLRPNACCTKPAEAAKTVDAIAGALRDVVTALGAGQPVSGPIITGKLNLVWPAQAGNSFSLLQKLESLYGLNRPPQSPTEEEHAADLAQVKRLLSQLRTELAARPAAKPASDVLPDVREKGNTLACQLDGAAEALDNDTKLECRWRQEPAGDMQLGNLFTWTRAFVAEELPNLVSGFGGDVSPSLSTTLGEQANRWEGLANADIKNLIGSQEIVAALRALAKALPPNAPSAPYPDTADTATNASGAAAL